MAGGMFKRLHFFAIAVFFVTLIIEIAFLISATPSLLAALGDWSIVIYTLVPLPIGVELWGGAHLAFTVILIIVILLSFLWAMLRRDGGLLHALVSRKRDVWAMGDLEAVGMALMGALSVNFIFYYIVMLGGYNPVVPEFPTNTLQFTELLFFASVWEELIIKLSFISLPLLVVHVIFRSPFEWWRYVAGGKIQMKLLTVLLMIFSAAVFGWAHVAGGWDLAKFVPTFVAGLMSAFLFIRYGLHASILFHFANNFLDVPYMLSNNEGVGTFMTIILLFFIAMGTIYWLMLARSMSGFFKRIASGQAEGPGAQAVSARPAQQGSSIPTHPTAYARQAQSYSCESCGGYEFGYSKGTFTCLRCGRNVGEPPKPPDDGKKDVMEL
jgi:hypothetical protein